MFKKYLLAKPVALKHFDLKTISIVLTFIEISEELLFIWVMSIDIYHVGNYNRIIKLVIKIFLLIHLKISPRVFCRVSKRETERGGNERESV